MITKFSVLYVGQIELENVGLGGTPTDERRYPNERLIEAFQTAKDVTQLMDERYRFDIAALLPGVFNGGPDGARAMLATIATSMMTAASVTFAITIAALASASTQFGSRLLRIFMRDTPSQIVLGTFTGTFIYCLLILRQIPSTTSELQVPQFSTTVALLPVVEFQASGASMSASKVPPFCPVLLSPQSDPNCGSLGVRSICTM